MCGVKNTDPRLTLFHEITLGEFTLSGPQSPIQTVGPVIPSTS